VFAVWLPMLAGDSRGAIDGSILDDRRVETFWDEKRLVGDWFGSHAVAGLGGNGYTVWDAYFAFHSDARWNSAPSGAVAAGSDIIGNTGTLEQRFLPLLG
jgi:hypothetical protein